MGSVSKSDIDRRERLDNLKLLASAIILIALGVLSFLLAERYNVPGFNVLLVWMGVAFIAVVGKDFRSSFKSPLFVSFFIAWLFVHLALSAVFLLYFSFTEWILASVLELALGYFLSHKLFNLPYPWDEQKS